MIITEVTEAPRIYCFDDALDIMERVRLLNLPCNVYAVCGGAMMVVRGIKPSTHDIDILITNEYWQKFKDDPEWINTIGDSGNCLRKDGIEILNELGFIKIPRIHEYIDNADMINGVPFVRLEDTIEWKTIAGREKDLNDNKLIWSYIHGN